MSNTTRWIFGILLIIFGVIVAAVFAFGGVFATVGCLQTPPSWAYGLTIAGAGAFLVAAIIPAVMLIRGAAGKRVVIALVIGGVFSCILFAIAFMGGIGQAC